MPIKKIVGLTVASLLVVSMTTIGTWAYFSDVETSTGNVLAAGTLDLKTDDIDGVSQTLFAVNMEPGYAVGPEYISLKNAGTVTGATLSLAFSYVESDLSVNPIDKSANETASMIEVTTLKYDGSSLLTSVADSNTNGYKDIHDLANADLSGLSGIGASASKDFEITIESRAEISNDYQGDGIIVTMTFTLNQ